MPEPVIRLEALSHAYEPQVPAIEAVTAEIWPGSIVGIIGHNGAGKTTLVKHLNGLLRPTSGTVWVDGQDTRTCTTAELARKVGLVFQNPDDQFFAGSCREELAFGLRNLGFKPDEIVRRSEAMLEQMGIERWADTPPAMLGYGQRRLVALASILVMQPPVLVLDEPTAGLDARSASALLAQVLSLASSGHTIILVTHDMALAAEHCQRCLVMCRGRLLRDDTTRSIFSDDVLLAEAGLMAPPLTRLARALTDLGMPGDALTNAEFAAAVEQLRGGTQ